MLRHDVDEALAHTISPVDFEIYLRSLGYKFVRNFKYEHPSIVAPDWQKPVRISSLGKDYSRQAILNRLRTQHEDRYFMDFYTPRPVVRRTLLILVIRNYEKEHTPDSITSLFELIITIAKICTGSNIKKADYRPLSPELRAEIINLDRTLEEYHFLCDKFINCAQDFVERRAEIVGKIESYEAERQHIRNQIRSYQEQRKWALYSENGVAVTDYTVHIIFCPLEHVTEAEHSQFYFTVCITIEGKNCFCFVLKDKTERYEERKNI